MFNNTGMKNKFITPHTGV